jgi:hypothetical protein
MFSFTLEKKIEVKSLYNIFVLGPGIQANSKDKVILSYEQQFCLRSGATMVL